MRYLGVRYLGVRYLCVRYLGAALGTRSFVESHLKKTDNLNLGTGDERSIIFLQSYTAQLIVLGLSANGLFLPDLFLC